MLPTTGIVDQGMAKYLADNIARRRRERRGRGRHQAQHARRRPDLDERHRRHAARGQVPVIVWVAPAGGFAASAGTFITLAANIALMAPGTSIGAASPISGEGKDIGGTLGKKVLNDAIAKITVDRPGARPERRLGGLGGPRRERRRRPARRSQLGAVDGIAATIDEVIGFANGKTVKVARRSRSRST